MVSAIMRPRASRRSRRPPVPRLFCARCSPSPDNAPLSRRTDPVMADAQPKTALVTGATNGIGIWTALGLAAGGATVGIVARDRARGEEMRRWLAERAPAGRVDLFVADLSSLAEVRRLAG